MVLTIFLARHGQDADNAAGILNGRRDEPLTKLGLDQARRLADQVAQNGDLPALPLRFDAIYASPLQRAFKTAEIVAERLFRNENANDDGGASSSSSSSNAVVVQRFDDLVERDFGVMTGIPVAEIGTRCSPNNVLQTDTVTYFLSPEGAETFPELMDRARRVLKSLKDRHEKGANNDDDHDDDDDDDDDVSILLVTHGDFGKMFYAAYYNLDWQDVLKGFHFGNSELILCSPKISNPTPEQTHVFTQTQHNT